MTQHKLDPLLLDYPLFQVGYSVGEESYLHFYAKSFDAIDRWCDRVHNIS